MNEEQKRARRARMIKRILNREGIYTLDDVLAWYDKGADLKAIRDIGPKLYEQITEGLGDETREAWEAATGMPWGTP